MSVWQKYIFHSDMKQWLLFRWMCNIIRIKVSVESCRTSGSAEVILRSEPGRGTGNWALKPPLCLTVSPFMFHFSEVYWFWTGGLNSLWVRRKWNVHILLKSGSCWCFLNLLMLCLHELFKGEVRSVWACESWTFVPAVCTAVPDVLQAIVSRRRANQCSPQPGIRFYCLYVCLLTSWADMFLVLPSGVPRTRTQTRTSVAAVCFSVFPSKLWPSWRCRSRRILASTRTSMKTRSSGSCRPRTWNSWRWHSRRWTLRSVRPRQTSWAMRTWGKKKLFLWCFYSSKK